MMKQGCIQTIYVCRLMLEHVVLVWYTVCLFLELCLSSWPPARKIFERALKMEKCCTTESCKHVPSQRWERDAGAVSSRQVMPQNISGVLECLAPVPLLRPALFSCYHQQMSHINCSSQHHHQLCFVHYGQPLTLCFFLNRLPLFV